MSAVLDVELANEPGEHHGPHGRRLAALVGVAAILASALAVLQMQASTAESRAHGMASRLTTEISRGLEVEGHTSSFELPSLQQLLTIAIESNARVLAALKRGDANVAELEAIAQAEGRATERLTKVVGEMAAVPGSSSGLDARTLATLRQTNTRLLAMTKIQNAQVDRAERFGTRGDRSTLALSLLAVAAVLLGLAGLVGGRGRAGSIVLLSAAGALLLSAAAGAWALLA